MDNLSLWKELRKRMSVGRAGGQSPAAGLPSPGARAAEQGTQRCRILPPERAQARLMGDGRRISARSSDSGRLHPHQHTEYGGCPACYTYSEDAGGRKQKLSAT